MTLAHLAGTSLVVLAGLGVSQVESTPAPGAPEAAALRARGLELGYNLDHREALAAFREAIAADPDNPSGYRLAAASTWIAILFEQGAVTVDDYLGEARSTVARPAPSPALATAFREFLQKAQTLSERRLKDSPRSADAHYQVGAAYGFQAAYTATVEGKVFGSFGAARRAYNEHERALELDPSRKDAGLVPGLYRYAISELSAPKRWFAHLAGFGGGRERGLALVEAAARYPSDVQPNALFTLILLYNREKRYDDALRTIAELRQRFPRNRLLWLESGSTALRAGRPADARRFLEEGLARFSADTRPRATGEEARWRFSYGSSLVALHDAEPAAKELNAALAASTRDWLRGRIHNELGKLADLAGARSRALTEYREAERLCRQAQDNACVDEAKALMKRAYVGRTS
jgi:tetratricopeptide (TPR) repeat protein